MDEILKTMVCPYCGTKFNKRKQASRHINHRPDICKKIETVVNVQTAKITKSLSELRAEYEQRINTIQEKNKKIVDTIVNVPASVKNRQREVENVECQGKIVNFERVMHRTIIPESVLRDTVDLMADGDILLFKRVFIEHTEEKMRCVRIKDFARDKYEYYDGKEWVTTTLDYIINHFAEELHKKYKFLIDEKWRKVKEIDAIFPPKYERFYEINAKKVDDLSIEYANITEHVTKLGVHDSDFLGQIKRGIKGFLVNPTKGITVEKKSEPFVYDEKIPDPVESEEIESKSESDDENQLGEVLIPILKIIGIRTDF